MNWVGLSTLTLREVGRFFSVYRQTVIPGLISSILYILIFGFTLERRISSISIEGVDIPYTLFIIPGLIMMNTLSNATSNSSSSMLQMKLLGQLPDLLQAPLSSLEISLAYIIGGMVRGTVNGILILLVAVVLSDITITQPLATIGFIMLVSWAFSSIGLILGQMAESWDQLATMQNFFLTPLSFLGGIFYSIKMLPEWAQSASFFNPIYYMINGLRYTIIGVSDSNPSTSFIIASLMTIGFTVIAIMLMENGKKIKQ
jgi:ABC-2 type transport system permease protein|tara:strand:+ start:730 stop:1503 length:774 start_codon:yes stop_codon:yes gene_type:complete